MKTYQLFINGQYVDPANNEWFESIDPYRGEPWAKIPRGSRADADKAVKAANEAMWRGPWSKMTASASLSPSPAAAGGFVVIDQLLGHRVLRCRRRQRFARRAASNRS